MLFTALHLVISPSMELYLKTQYWQELQHNDDPLGTALLPFMQGSCVAIALRLIVQDGGCVRAWQRHYALLELVW